MIHQLHYNNADEYGKLDVGKCENRQYKKGKDIMVDYINPSDFVQILNLTCGNVVSINKKYAIKKEYKND